VKIRSLLRRGKEREGKVEVWEEGWEGKKWASRAREKLLNVGRKDQRARWRRLGEHSASTQI